MKRLFILTLVFCAVASAAQNFNVSPDLRKHVEYLCSPDLKGRAAGTPGERAAAGYVYDRLSAAGVTMLTDSLGQDFTITDPAGDIASLNIVGIVEGYDNKLREEYVVVGAHVDGMGTNNMMVDGRTVEQLYPCADANASGVSVMIELARMVSQCKYMFPRSVIFVAFGAGEKAVAGSWYFANRAFSEMRSVRAMIDLNMLGHMSAATPFQVLTQVSASDLGHVMELTREEPVVILPEVAKSLGVASDYLPFYEKKIPVFCFTTGMSKEYRTAKDRPGSLDYGGMELECNYVFHFLKSLANCGEDMPAMDDKKTVTKKQDDLVHSVSECDRKPQFFHSDERHFLEAWVYKYLKYPAEAIHEGIQGTVLVSFIVEKNGAVTDVRLERGVDELLDAEALKVVSVSPKWIPGQIRGNKVRTRITVPVEFRLTDSKNYKIKLKR